MEGRDLVYQAIKFDSPKRLPFYHSSLLENNSLRNLPIDAIESREMNRAKRGWFFGHAGEDDWGCVWQITKNDNMGIVKGHPLKDWSQLKNYQPPDPDDTFYYERISETFEKAENKYVVLTSHFNLIERLHMLHGFKETLIDLHRCPEKIEKVLDLITDFKISMIRNVKKQFGSKVHGIFFTDDWGTQQGTFINREFFRKYFKPRYEKLVNTVHDANYHFILHSCGKKQALSRPGVPSDGRIRLRRTGQLEFRTRRRSK